MGNQAELATVIHNFLHRFNKKNKLPAHKLKVLDALLKCRTEYMGGRVEACSSCGEVNIIYNSCRNRHCPKCGSIAKEKWIIAREADLLPVKYFHVVFTVPDSLNALFMNNQKQMYNLLFSIGWEVLKDFGASKKWIGGKIGATAILHTWGQNLNYHPHIHFIVPAGALMPDQKWKHSRKRGKYLFKVDQISAVFRARFVESIRAAHEEKLISGEIPKTLFNKDWVVYAKQPFGGPKQVIRYLGRYTHRTAISNNRILKVDANSVTFSWNDYRQNNKKQITTLKGEDFLRLFCQHIIEPRYTRIRHYGILSSASKVKSCAVIRKNLRVYALDIKAVLPWQEVALLRMGINPGVCKCCKGKMFIIEIIPNSFRKNQRAPPSFTEKMVKTNRWCTVF